MIYIENEDNIGLYEIKINENNLKNIRKRIIYNCGLITVKIKETTKENLFPSERYIVHSKEQIDTNYNYEPIYEIVYQEIIFPPIVDIISKILNGQEKEVLNLFTTNDLKASKLEEFNKIKESILLKLNNLSINTKNLCVELELINHRLIKLSKKYSFENFDKVKPVSDFYKEIVECIQLIPRKIISKDEYKNMIEFLGAKKEVNTMNDSVKKLIRINKK